MREEMESTSYSVVKSSFPFKTCGARPTIHNQLSVSTVSIRSVCTLGLRAPDLLAQ